MKLLTTALFSFLISLNALAVETSPCPAPNTSEDQRTLRVFATSWCTPCRILKATLQQAGYRNNSTVRVGSQRVRVQIVDAEACVGENAAALGYVNGDGYPQVVCRAGETTVGNCFSIHEQLMAVLRTIPDATLDAYPTLDGALRAIRSGALRIEGARDIIVQNLATTFGIAVRNPQTHSRKAEEPREIKTGNPPAYLSADRCEPREI